jgi:hypothetical protein
MLREGNIPIAIRLVAKVRPDANGCWNWLGVKNSYGYGRIRVGKIKVDRQMMLAHRAAYEIFVGPIPKGKELDHMCRNRACINPVHTRPVTHQQNAILREESKVSQGETVLMHDVLEAIGASPLCRVWRNQTGALPDPRTPGRWISFGKKGSADIIGLLCTGRFLAVETKMPKYGQSEDQKKFQAMVEKFGGLYIVGRSVEQVVIAIEEAVHGFSGGREAGKQQGSAIGNREGRGPVAPGRPLPVSAPLQRGPARRHG